MQHRVLQNYLDNVEQAIESLENVDVERYVEEHITPERTNLRIRIRFEQGILLAINEAIALINAQLTTLDYRYHCQDNTHQLVFRYDSTPHFPNLSTFPHHKHLPDDVIASDKPTIMQVLQEVVQFGDL